MRPFFWLAFPDRESNGRVNLDRQGNVSIRRVDILAEGRFVRLGALGSSKGFERSLGTRAKEAGRGMTLSGWDNGDASVKCTC